MKKSTKQNIINTDLFVDSYLANYLIHWVDNLIGNKKEYVRGESAANCEKRKVNALLEHLFSDIFLKEIDVNLIRQKLENSTNIERIYLFRVILSLLVDDLIIDSKLKRITVFKDRFLHVASLNEYNYLMSCSDGYLCKYFSANDESTSDIFFYSIDDVKFENDNIKATICGIIDEIKLTDKYTHHVKKQKLLATKKISEQYFKVRSLSEFDISQFKDEHNIAELSDIIRQLCNNDNIKIDQTLKYLGNIISGYSSSYISKKEFKDICTVNSKSDIYQYFVIENRGLKYPYKTDIPYGSELYNEIINFVVDSTYEESSFRYFIEHFKEASNLTSTFCIHDLTYQSFVSAMSYYGNSKKYNQYLISFYNYLYYKYDYDFFKKSNISITVLNRLGVLNELSNGYNIINYNPHDMIPRTDKWLLCYNPSFESNTINATSKTIAIDFTIIHDLTFRYWVKYYVWNYDKSLKIKATKVPILAKSLNYIDDIRTGKAISLYCRKTDNAQDSITVPEALAVRMYWRNAYNDSVTGIGYISDFQILLRFIGDEKVATIPLGATSPVFTAVKKESNAKCISDNELAVLTKKLIQEAVSSLSNYLYAIIYLIAIDTELRISEIVELDYNCVMETVKKNEYIIKTRRKDKSTNVVEIPITLETKRAIDEVIKETSSVRKNAPSTLKNKLFITSSNGSSSVRKITTENFRKYLIKCCEEVNLPRYTAENLRDTHMTKARLYKIQKQLSDAEIGILTGHKTKDIDMEHYVDISIETMLEAVHGVVIGNIDLQGKIVTSAPISIANIANEVSNGCGYCSSNECQNYSYVDCLLCKNFVTMPSRIPFFEEQLKQLDCKIKCVKTPHDKEDVISIKKLLLGYITAINSIDMNEEGKNDC